MSVGGNGGEEKKKSDRPWSDIAVYALSWPGFVPLSCISNGVVGVEQTRFEVLIHPWAAYSAPGHRWSARDERCGSASLRQSETPLRPAAKTADRPK